ncbi:IS110 family transposase [Candidatus Bipolaricaulota bacterium]
MQCIAFDSHKHYTWALVETEKGKLVREQRIDHARGALRGFLEEFEPGSPVAVETIGNWYWITDEIEAAGMVPQLVNARKAKLMSGSINKTDRLDAKGINRLQRSGTLPTVWIPPRELRDARELPRTRMVLVRQRTQLKNRIHANLAKYGLKATGVSDLFGVRGRRILDDLLNEFPTQTRYATEALIEELDHLQAKIKELEGRIAELFDGIESLQLIQTLPGVALILGVVILTEVGVIERFPSASHLASYAGKTPRVHASGGHVRYGRTRPDVNHYLKWAYTEAANSVMMHRRQHPQRHVSRLYERIQRRRGHQKAIGAVGRHLAEATYWMLMKKEAYRDPATDRVEVESKKEA